MYTLANPGWTVKIDLLGTLMEDKLFAPIDNDNNKRWISCRVENNVFIGNGDETNYSGHI
ncbi:Imm53 family immunity protein [Candidatus Enterococcus clewellii]|uniref:Imm53 family immunity protein n=1 Tax=Candidatus Enterococcus clewellii TaxID=1834193 RepID=UPI003BB1B8E4